ncbi:MAG: biopolymer transporter ExbD [Proteobacteria bacterium]|nr:biopolymer transporter ExbD [Pseudomonadota bacterium]
MAVKAGDGDPDVMADINITPFTDVLLVLLIIFMVAATAVVQNGFNINLPKEASTTSADDPSGIIVSVSVPDAVKVNGQPVAANELEGYLRRLKENKNTDRVIIMAEDNVEYLQVVSVMDSAKAVGLTGIALAAQPK